MVRYIPRTEHPRPDFQREQWLNLNGLWEFEFDPRDRGMAEGWQQGQRTFSREIAVPFPWESPLSGVHDPDYRGLAWYKRTFTVPDGWEGRRVLLKFGAVDWTARVWVNSRFIGLHRGGYSPFQFDITDALQLGDNLLVVRVFDDCSPEHPTGKQINWYTPSSGIWQTVYLEATGPARIERIHITPDVPGAQAHFDVTIVGRADYYALELTFPQHDLSEVRRTVLHNGDRTDVRVTVPIPDPQLWSPDQPTLYDVTATLLQQETLVDQVHTYFGMRQIQRARWEDRPYEYILLNGEPIYLRGALHQSFHPDGLYTYPSDSILRNDIERAKEYGFNCLRVHIKMDEPRLYYWADRLGMLILYDIPNFWKDSDRARAFWEQTLRDAIARDFNHPSILAWVLFNETWGIGDGGFDEDTQRWVTEMFHLAKRLDPTRLVEDNSPCNWDHLLTDINSWHFYIDDYERTKAHIAEVVENTYPGSPFNYVPGRTQGTEPLINSEFGAVSASGGDRDISWGLKYQINELRKHDKICGYVYTEFCDIEWEHNGILNYDRSRKEFGYNAHVPGFSVRHLNAPDFLVLDAAPCSRASVGESFVVPVMISHWSDRTADALTLHWQLSGLDVRGRTRVYAQGSRPAEWRRFSVHPLGEIRLELPEEPCLATLAVWLSDSKRPRLAVNYLHVLVEGPVPRAEKIHPGTVLGRFRPEDYAAAEWSGRRFPDLPGKVAGCGHGFFEYHLRLPADLSPTDLESIDVVFEGASKADDEKLDWPDRRTELDYPQTDTRKHPTDLRLSLNGVAFAELHFADDPADARGVLSHLAGVQHGSYGELTRIGFAVTEELRQALENEGYLRLRFEVLENTPHPGGFSLYGVHMGRYPCDPHLIVRYRNDRLPEEWTSDEPLALHVHSQAEEPSDAP